MPGPDSNRTERWLYALKPPSWPKLLVPMVLGIVLGARDRGSLNGAAVAVAVLFTSADTVFIVLLNDWADQGVDRVKRNLFPDAGSPKVLVDGILSSRSALAVALLAALFALLVAIVGGAVLERPWLAPGAFCCLTLFVLYSLPPVRLNYRGGGELLEALGVGAALPWLCAYCQSGALWTDGLWFLPGFVALSLSSAIASGLSDEESDRAGGKTTLATVAGNAVARRAAEVSATGGAAWWLALAAWKPEAMPIWAVAPAVAVVLLRLRAVVRQSPLATTNRFDALREYKRKLHRVIWDGALLLALLLAADALAAAPHVAAGQPIDPGASSAPR